MSDPILLEAGESAPSDGKGLWPIFAKDFSLGKCQVTNVYIMGITV